jgi:uncharacterized protein (TIGR02145 family)
MPYLKHNGQMVVSGGSYLTSPSQIIDYDGNIYTTIEIGTQIWLVENLLTTSYNNGTSIPNITDNTLWTNATSGAYAWYDNDAASYKNVYGALYNWFAVDDINALAPTGTRVADKTDWDLLISFVGGSSIAGGKLKEAGLTHWDSPNSGATNEYGFTALPGGYRRGDAGTFETLGDNGLWWADFEVTTKAQRYYMQSAAFTVQSDAALTKPWGHSVRCILI